MINKLYFSILAVFISIFVQQQAVAQTALIKGTVTDAKTGETLIGASVYLQGTNIGTITDLDGNYTIKNIAPGNYNLISSYISYNQKVIRVAIGKTGETIHDFALDAATVTLAEVKVTARKRQDTEMAMISAIKAQDLIVSGISSQQIQKSQDKDAAEVLRRVPGITITDGRFVIVRGLIERYNSVLLNGASAPSSEADVRAFSFDVIPSNMIDNMLIYKTPAPELPADFAGAAINVVTKNTVDQNSVNASYSLGYIPGSTNEKFYTYKGGKFDWLGFDDGTRALPTSFPAHNQMNDSLFRFDYKPGVKDNITKISKSFRNDVFAPYTKIANPNQSASIGFTKRFVLGNVTLGNITSVNYFNGNVVRNVDRNEYQDPNPIAGEKSYYFDFSDARYINEVRAGIIHNWALIFNDNHKIEFRNFLNQNAFNRTVVRTGIDYYSNPSEGDTVLGYAMEFNQRTTYSGQLAGKSFFNNKNTDIDWLLGYSYANKLQPDMKRLRFEKMLNEDAGIYQYRMSLANSLPLPERGGRFYIASFENIENAALNLKQTMQIADREVVVKAGIFYEEKSRQFDARNIGIVYNNSLPVNLYAPIDSIINDSNFYLPGGFAYNENSLRSNRYNAKSTITAMYAGIKVPFTKHISLYTGVRFEKFQRTLSNFQKDVKNIPNIALDTLDIFFSSNLSIAINTENVFRLSYGKTINRPEFREIAPFYFNDFDLNAGVWGNDTIKSCYINNYDIRYEWYPSAGEMVSLAFFYKKFENPIEILLVETGNQPDYKPFNTESAVSKGLEIDVRKSFESLGDKENMLRYFKNLTLIFNGSIIRSNVKTNLSFAREKERVMMGQSPYIINTGLYYRSEKAGFNASIIFNRMGQRIIAVGTPSNPHTWELARSTLDVTLSKHLYKGLDLKLGIKDILNEPYERVQYDYYTPSSGGSKVKLTETTFKYTPGTQYSAGLSYTL